MKFSVGDKVKAVAETHGWGGVKCGDNGVITGFQGDSYIAEFPNQSHWTGGESCFELITAPKTKYKVGDKLIPNSALKDDCISFFDDSDTEYILITSVDVGSDGDPYYAWSVYRNGNRVDSCAGHTEAFKEPMSYYGKQELTLEDVAKAVDTALKQHTQDLEMGHIQNAAYKKVLGDQMTQVVDREVSVGGFSGTHVGFKTPVSKFTQSLKKVAGHRNAKIRFG